MGRGKIVLIMIIICTETSVTTYIILTRQLSHSFAEERVCILVVIRRRICCCCSGFRCCSSGEYPPLPDCNSDACDETEQSCELWICKCLDTDPYGVEQYPLEEVDKLTSLGINSDSNDRYSEDNSQNIANSVVFCEINKNIQLVQ
jgi:hypothetical protein